MNERERRIGLNEAVFRHVNERIRELGSTFDLAQPLDFVCECGDDTCTERIELTVSEYERVRSDPALFAVVPGHQTEDVDDVVAVEKGYAVVRKHSGGPERLATATDPRS